MKAPRPADEAFLRELRLYLEETCCDLLRFQHVRRDGVAPEDVDIDQEVYLGTPGAFADIRVQAPNSPPYFVEIKYGYSADTVLSHLSRKYGRQAPVCQAATKLVLVIHTDQYPDWPGLEAKIRSALRPGLRLEVWNIPRLLEMLREQFGLKFNTLTESNLVQFRQTMDCLKGRHAFGESFSNTPLEASLLWQFGFWRLRQLREQRRLSPRDILPPGEYEGVAVLMADLSGFSSYVRNSRDDEMVRHILTSFYTKARSQVLNAGGMMYQFIGDGLLALFGIPDRKRRYVEDALECARALLDVGNSVSNEWQRYIDHVQESGGCHFGLALGDLQIVPMRPFGRARVGAIGDCINLAARLQSAAGPSEIVVSNSFYQKLPERKRHAFQEMQPVEARHIGKIRCWKLPAPPPCPAAQPGRGR